MKLGTRRIFEIFEIFEFEIFEYQHKWFPVFQTIYRVSVAYLTLSNDSIKTRRIRALTVRNASISSSSYRVGVSLWSRSVYNVGRASSYS